MRSALEALMYSAFCAAALPMAAQALSDLLYYRAHHDMLQSRDAAPEVFAAVWAVEIMKPALGLAAILALYFLVTGLLAVGFSSSALVIAWILTPAFGRFVGTSTPFASTARLYWDAVPFATLCLLPWVCGGIRFARRNARPLSSHDEPRGA